MWVTHIGRFCVLGLLIRTSKYNQLCMDAHHDTSQKYKHDGILSFLTLPFRYYMLL